MQTLEAILKCRMRHPLNSTRRFARESERNMFPRHACHVFSATIKLDYFLVLCILNIKSLVCDVIALEEKGAVGSRATLPGSGSPAPRMHFRSTFPPSVLPFIHPSSHPSFCHLPTHVKDSSKGLASLSTPLHQSLDFRRLSVAQLPQKRNITAQTKIILEPACHESKFRSPWLQGKYRH